MPLSQGENQQSNPPLGDDRLAAFLKRSPILRILLAAHLFVPFGILVLSITFSAVLSLSLFLGAGEALSGLFLLSGVLAIVAGIVGAERLHSQLLKPLVRLESSVADVCQGEPGASLPLENVGVLGAVMHDIDSLSGELTEVYEDMENRVDRQTRRLAQQTASLKILYDVAAGINQAGDLDSLLIHFLRVLKKLINGRAATVCLVTQEGQMQLVGSVDENDRVLDGKEQLPLRLCECGKALSDGDILCEKDTERCSHTLGRSMYGKDQIEVATVPLKYHDDELGVYRVYVKKPGISGREDLLDLLSTIGNHLGMAVAKHRSDEEARRLSIIEERTTLAHELHDSLAQTLVSLRFQVRMLEESLGQASISDSARLDLHRIRNGLDEAHTELRGLLNSFLAPVDQRGLGQAMEKLTQRFRQETGIPIFFQQDSHMINLIPGEEMQILRIVQECLANIRKHAGAHTVRVLLANQDSGGYLILVEDDGIGFDASVPKGSPGEHVGLSIMEERARRLGGELRIESEPDEGTRVELTYNPRAEQTGR